MMSKALDWVRRDFCRLNNISLNTALEVVQHGRAPSNDFQFTVNGPGYPNVGFTLERINLKPYSSYTPLILGEEWKDKSDLLTKETLCRWFNSKTGLGLVPDDIGNILIQKDRVVVVSAANSMRFKHTFSMRFK
jgi:hypothetical protein